MSKTPIITLFAELISVAALANSELPKLPYYDWGACPFEGCIYQQWEAIEPVTVYQSRAKNSKIAFKVKKGEFVDAVTGVVITYECGKTKVLKP